MPDRWFTGHRARQDRAFLDRAQHLYRTDPEYRARHDAEQAAMRFRSRVLARYGRIVGEAMKAGTITPEEAFQRAFAAQDRTAESLEAARRRIFGPL